MANNLKYLRFKADMSQEEVGKRLGVSKQYICMLETEKTPLTLRYKIKLAKVYGISEDEIKSDNMSKRI